jgi:two-component system phosphate regulon sensor histidine kinase PhoR
MRTWSFFTTLFIGNFFLVCFILCFGFWWTTYEVNRNVLDVSRRFQFQFLNLVKWNFESSWGELDRDRVILDYCESYSRVSGLRLTVVGVDGCVLGDSEYPFERMLPHNTDEHPEVLAALRGECSESTRMSQTRKIRYRYIAAPVEFGGEVVAMVRVALPVSDLHEDRRNIFYGVLTGFVLMLFVAMVLSVFLFWIWYKPLNVISDSAKRIADGNFEPIPQASSSRELVQLIDAINRMRKTVSSQLDTISRQRERLQIILQNLPDAVFAINAADQVVYFNETAKRIFELESVGEVIPLQRLLRHSVVLDFFFRHREGGLSGVVRERVSVKVGERKYSFELEMLGVPSDADNNEISVLLLFNDVTAIESANRMKADFVANTSHELRTPLATIRATLDNINDGICDDSELFRDVLGILDRHVSRLEVLTEDLLDLHDVEREGVAERKSSVTANVCRDKLFELFSVKAAEKGVGLFVGSKMPDRVFLTDEKRLDLLLQNLVDNAIKFTPSGGEVNVEFVFDEPQVLTILCQDNGCGILESEQTRVFERFYRAKTHDNGTRIPGTGLGLAIVKHAVDRLNGTITLKSEPNQGCKFTIKIPI